MLHSGLDAPPHPLPPGTVPEHPTSLSLSASRKRIPRATLSKLSHTVSTSPGSMLGVESHRVQNENSGHRLLVLITSYIPGPGCRPTGLSVARWGTADAEV